MKNNIVCLEKECNHLYDYIKHVLKLHYIDDCEVFDRYFNNHYAKLV